VTPQPAPGTSIFAFGVCLIILILVLLYLLFIRLWPGHLPLGPEENHGVVKLPDV